MTNNDYEAMLRHQAEIIDILKLACEEKNKEIERQKRILDSYAIQYGTVKDQQKVIDKAKAEAVREFAERLKEMCDAPYWCVWLSDIDNLLEEMEKENET